MITIARGATSESTESVGIEELGIDNYGKRPVQNGKEKLNEQTNERMNSAERKTKRTTNNDF